MKLLEKYNILNIMEKLIVRILCIGIALFAFIQLWDGVTLDVSEQDFLFEFIKLLGLFLIIELVIHPILRIITLPIRWLTLGLASIALSVGLIYFVSYIYDPFMLESIINAVVVGFVFGLIRIITD